VTSAREGADVVVVDIADQVDTIPYPMSSPADLDETVRQVEALDRRALARVADVRSQEQLDQAVATALAEFGHIDALIANAGIFTPGLFWELTDQAWDDVIGVNLSGVWKSAKAVAPHMIERQSGSIVITASVKALGVDTGYAHYISAKHGLIGLMKSIALELAPHGIRRNAVAPGSIHTPMVDYPAAWDRYAGHPGGTEQDLIDGGYRFAALRGHSFLPAQSVADTALYLNSDLAAMVTGVTIPVDAGHLLMPGRNDDPVR
jgi:NAD(P)-dependent dehydrogenase (short-subunit alcohol dehydrogenase family)